MSTFPLHALAPGRSLAPVRSPGGRLRRPGRQLLARLGLVRHGGRGELRGRLRRPEPAQSLAVRPGASAATGRARRGMTLMEVVIVLLVGTILFVAVPWLAWHGVRVFVWLPRQAAVNQAAVEILQQLLEGGWSTLPGQPAPIRGMRFAVRRGATEPALWLAEPTRLGIRTSDDQLVLIRLDGDVLKRSVPAAASCTPVPGVEEPLPYHAPGQVRITTTGPMWRYYNQSGAEIAPGCPPSAAVRRIDIEFMVQTGSGVFDEGQARTRIRSAMAVRIP